MQYSVFNVSVSNAYCNAECATAFVVGRCYALFSSAVSVPSSELFFFCFFCAFYWMICSCVFLYFSRLLQSGAHKFCEWIEKRLNLHRLTTTKMRCILPYRNCCCSSFSFWISHWEEAPSGFHANGFGTLDSIYQWKTRIDDFNLRKYEILAHNTVHMYT